jgi:hypothetical protein
VVHPSIHRARSVSYDPCGRCCEIGELAAQSGGWPRRWVLAVPEIFPPRCLLIAVSGYLAVQIPPSHPSLDDHPRDGCSANAQASRLAVCMHVRGTVRGKRPGRRYGMQEADLLCTAKHDTRCDDLRTSRGAATRWGLFSSKPHGRARHRSISGLSWSIRR